jgi:hypothetical protein
MTNVQRDQTPAEREKTLKKFENSSRKTVAEQSMSSQHHWDQLWSLPGDLNRKFEHVPHCRKVCSPTVEYDQKQRRINKCLELREKANKDPAFICRIITGDESWIYGYEPETKQQSSQWKSRQSPRTKNAWQVHSSTKSMLIVFLDVKGIIDRKFVPPNTSVNSDF